MAGTGVDLVQKVRLQTKIRFARRKFFRVATRCFGPENLGCSLGIVPVHFVVFGERRALKCHHERQIRQASDGKETGNFDADQR